MMPVVTLIGLSLAGSLEKAGRKKMFRTVMIIVVILFVVGFLFAWVKAMKYDKKNVEGENTEKVQAESSLTR